MRGTIYLQMLAHHLLFHPKDRSTMTIRHVINTSPEGTLSNLRPVSLNGRHYRSTSPHPSCNPPSKGYTQESVHMGAFSQGCQHCVLCHELQDNAKGKAVCPVRYTARGSRFNYVPLP